MASEFPSRTVPVHSPHGRRVRTVHQHVVRRDSRLYPYRRYGHGPEARTVVHRAPPVPPVLRSSTSVLNLSAPPLPFLSRSYIALHRVPDRSWRVACASNAAAHLFVPPAATRTESPRSAGHGDRRHQVRRVQAAGARRRRSAAHELRTSMDNARTRPVRGVRAGPFRTFQERIPSLAIQNIPLPSYPGQSQTQRAMEYLSK